MGIKVTLVSFTPNYMDNISGAMSKCYEKKAGHKAVIKHAVEAGHFSSLEHSIITIDLEFSLAVLGQFTRHRHLSPTVKSSRGADFKPEFITPARIKDSKFLQEYLDFMFGAFYFYDRMVKSGIPHEDAAYVLPKGALTKLRVTANVRAWFEYLPKRLCNRAMPEHREVAKLIHKCLIEAMPEIFDRDFMNCADCKEHGCKFH